MRNSNLKKQEQLKMPPGTAVAILRKNVLFSLLVKYKENICYQCSNTIESVDELSMEHKTPWLDSENPVKLFFDVDNIAFSHLRCNISAARQKRNRVECPDGKSWCHRCREYKSLDEFSPGSKWNGTNSECKTCKSKRTYENRHK